MSSSLDRLTDVFQDLFDDDELVITRDTTAADIEDWDSLMHVTLVVNVEREFDLTFKSSDVSKLKSVGDLMDLIEGE